MILFLLSRFSSAGIGRTGTFIALDTLLKEIAVADSIDVINCVSKLRQQRAFSIQTDVSLPPPFNSLTLFEFTEDLRKQIRMLDIWYCNIISSFESQRPIFDWKYIYSTNIFEFEFLLSTHWKCGLPKNWNSSRQIWFETKQYIFEYLIILRNLLFFYRCNMHSYRKPLFTPLLIMATLLSPSIKWMKCDEFQMKDANEIGKRC